LGQPQVRRLHGVNGVSERKRPHFKPSKVFRDFFGCFDDFASDRDLFRARAKTGQGHWRFRTREFHSSCRLWIAARKRGRTRAPFSVQSSMARRGLCLFNFPSVRLVNEALASTAKVARFSDVPRYFSHRPKRFFSKPSVLPSVCVTLFVHAFVNPEIVGQKKIGSFLARSGWTRPGRGARQSENS